VPNDRQPHRAHSTVHTAPSSDLHPHHECISYTSFTQCLSGALPSKFDNISSWNVQFRIRICMYLCIYRYPVSSSMARTPYNEARTPPMYTHAINVGSVPRTPYNEPRTPYNEPLVSHKCIHARGYVCMYIYV